MSLMMAPCLNLDYKNLCEAPAEPLNTVEGLGSAMRNVGLYDD